jgi:ABC-type transporter Mla subunit MlaD
MRAVQAVGGSVTAAEGIIRNAQSLQDVTAHTLDQFDSYMTQINTVRERDEGFEKRAAELLNQMRQESKDMASLIAGLTEKMQALSDREDDSAEKSLAEIRDLMTTLNTNVKTVSDTLSRLSEEV